MKDSLLARLRGQNEDEGFTLVELLIVIVILGILAAIVVFSVSGVTDNGKQSACQTNVKTIDTALESYYAQNSGAAANFNDLVSGGFMHADANINGAGTTIAEGDYTITFVAPGDAITATLDAGNAGGVKLSGTVPSGCAGG